MPQPACGWLTTAASPCLRVCTGAAAAYASNGCAADPIQSPRLPLDWSYAGYQMGAQPLPRYPVRANVKAFGAKGDGKADDTQAILRAIQACPDNSAVYLPAGRYRITQRIVVCKRAIAIQGDGPGRTTLFFPNSLADLYGDVRGGGEPGSLTISAITAALMLTMQGVTEYPRIPSTSAALCQPHTVT